MESNNFTDVIMTLGKIKEYLSEWYYKAEFSIAQQPAEYDSTKLYHVIKEEKTGEVVFVWESEMGASFDESTIVSTSGIVGDELRGLIAQCYTLDKQLEESLTSDKRTQTDKTQKGE